MNILVMEASTSSAKAMIYECETGKKHIHQIKYTNEINKVKTQDADGVFETTIQCCKELINQVGLSIDTIAVCSVWHSYVLLDENRKPITKVRTWADTQSATVISEYKNDEKTRDMFYRKTGCNIHSKYPCWKWYDDTQNLIIKDFRKVNISSVPEYIFEKLTNEKVVSKSVASGTGLLNIYTLEWDKEILEFMNIKENQLSKLKEYDYCGRLCKEPAFDLGINEGIKVIIPGSDGSYNQIGEGGLNGNIMTMSIGTSSAVRLSSDVPILPKKPSTWCYYIGDKKRIVGAAIAAGGNCIDWFMSKMLNGSVDFDTAEKLLCEVDVDNAPIFMPFLDGEQSPGWDDTRMGIYSGLTSKHSISDMYYAVLEGILLNLYHCYTCLTELMEEPHEIRLSGGILNSIYWTKLVADLFQIPITTSKHEHASMMGALAISLKTVGLLDDIGDFNNDMDRVIYPDTDKRALYKKRFAKYLECYQRSSANTRKEESFYE